jgi:uncharacterized membrane protein
MTTLRNPCSLLALIVLTPASRGQPQLINLSVTTGDTSFTPTALSSDGRVVVGTVMTTQGQRAARWSQTDGLQVIGVLSGGAFSRASSTSGDGSVVVGSSSSSDGFRGFIWTLEAGIESLGVLEGDSGSVALDISRDGTTVVGQSSSLNSSKAFVWRRQVGMLALPSLFENAWAFATAVSADGSVIVGSNEGLDLYQSFRWTEATGANPVPQPEGAYWSSAVAISDDGFTVASWSFQPIAPSVWNQVTGPRRIGQGPTSGFSLVPLGMTGSGDIVVGRYESVLGDAGFVWSARTCTMELNEFLHSNGVSNSNVFAQVPISISADGTSMTFVGFSEGVQAYWLVNDLVTSISACDCVNFNNDGAAFDPQDIEAFLSVYSEGPCIPESADCGDIDFNNDESSFDPCDIQSFLSVYSEGPCTLCGE